MLTPYDAFEATGGVDETIYAFPSGVPHQGNTWASDMGMPLRDYFAAKALQGLLSDLPKTLYGLDWEAKTVASAYSIADAMLEARK